MHYMDGLTQGQLSSGDVFTSREFVSWQNQGILPQQSTQVYFLHVPEHISLCSLISANVYWPIPLCWGSFCSMTVAILVSQTAQRKGFIISSLSYDLLVLHCCDSSNMPFATDAMKVLVRLWVYGRECNESMNFGAPTGPPESHQSDSLLLHHDFSTKIPSWWSSCSEFFQ